MIVWIELSGENPALALAESKAATEFAKGTVQEGGRTPPSGFVAVDLPGRAAVDRVSRSLGLAHRILEPWPSGPSESIDARVVAEAADSRSASFRPLGRPGAALDQSRMLGIARRYRESGGAIDLEHPQRRFWVFENLPAGTVDVAEEVAAIDRAAFDRRRMPLLRYRRPVSLPPRLARAAANLARVGPGSRVVDPFLGTGALLLEAALLGARVSGVDADPEMVRGALENFRSFGLSLEEVRVADAADARPPAEGELWDAVLTDPPYGRASSSQREPPEELLRRSLPRWGAVVRPGGVMVVIVPGGPDPLTDPWRCVEKIPDRVHRSLTREFRVYARAGDRTRTG